MLGTTCAVAMESVSCPNTTATGETRPLYLLTLVPFPDSEEESGWDKGLGTIPGARVARDEINDRIDLLHGYHIELIERNIEACSRTDAADGLKNLVKYTVDPPCRPLAAVTGLMCSSHTELVSPVAGHVGMDLLQLAVANSPTFALQNDSFPHLWRFLGTGTAYADATLALMNQFGWRRIGILYTYGSAYFTNVAAYFQRLVQSAGDDKEVIFSAGITRTDEVFFQQIISDIKSEAATVLFISLNDQQSAELLCRIAAENLTAPSYIWLQVGRRLDRILAVTNKSCNDTTIIQAKQGHIELQFLREEIKDNLVSGENYSNYETSYREELEEVQYDYNVSISEDLLYSNLLYDQVWAFALAMNNSLSVLAKRNLSIDNYTIGQNQITKIIEEQMGRLRFQGASGFIEFDQKHGVLASVGIYRVNQTDHLLVGTFLPQMNTSNQISYKLSLNISPDDVPDDDPPVMFILIPLPVAAVLYSATGLTILFTTVILILLMYYREWPEVKASSPYISLFMIAGCWLLCVAVVSRTTYGWLHTEAIQLHYTVLVCIDLISSATGLSMVIITMFFRLLRVYHIFSTMTLKLRIFWKTISLSLVIFVLFFWITILLLALVLFHPPILSYSESFIFKEPIIVAEKQPYPALHLSIIIALIVIAIFLLVFLLGSMYLAIRMRKIKRNDFKDTKKINLFVAILTITIVMTALTIVPLTLSNNHYIANIVMAVALLIIPNAISIILFLPKVIPAMRNKDGPRPRRRSSTSFYRQSSLNIRRHSTRMSIMSLPVGSQFKSQNI